MISFCLDSNVFDFLLDNEIDINKLNERGIYFTSNIQKSEILNIKNETRREKLLKVYSDLNQSKSLLESGIWIDELRWDDDQPWIDEIGVTAINLTGNSEKKPWRDALLGEIAKKNNLVLVSGDKSFLNRARKNKIETMTIEEFILFINSESK